MRKIFLILTVFFSLSAFEIHKFYVSIYQINFNQKDKRLELTSRIFIDDLKAALKLKYNQKIYISEKEETQEDFNLTNKYLLENFSIKVNGVPKPINYLSKEIDTNVLICYYSIKDISKIKTLEISNTSLFNLNSEQQNIIQTNIYGKKQSLLLTNNNEKGTIKIE